MIILRLSDRLERTCSMRIVKEQSDHQEKNSSPAYTGPRDRGIHLPFLVYARGMVPL
jgi:hypothetical protein